MKQKGSTLIELILYVGLTSILIAIMSQVFLATLGVSVESQKTNDVQRDGRYILSRIQYDVRRATSIIAPGIGETSTTLSLLISENGIDQTYQYTFIGSNMTLTTGSTPVELNGTGTTIRALSFTRLGNSEQLEDAKDTVEINITLDGNQDIPQATQSFTLHTTVGLR